MRSLFFEYPRKNDQGKVFANLFTIQRVNMKVNLPILYADTHGVELEFPSGLTGMFYLTIEDGDQSFLKKISIQ